MFVTGPNNDPTTGEKEGSSDSSSLPEIAASATYTTTFSANHGEGEETTTPLPSSCSLVNKDATINHGGPTKESTAGRRRIRFILAAIVLLVVAAVVIAVVFLVRMEKGDSNENQAISKTVPTPAPTADSVRASQILEVVTSVTLSDVVLAYPPPLLHADTGATTTPEQQAVTWLIEDSYTEQRVPLFDTIRLSQRYALATIWYATGGSGWLFVDGGVEWLHPDASECQWDGIECVNGLVTQLQLDDFDLRNSIPPDIGLLQNLILVDVSENYLRGTIPWSSFEQLKRLQVFRAASNNLGGPLSPAIGDLPLHEFVVRDNFMNGTLPTEIGRWSMLEVFDIASNEFGGTLPMEFGEWNALVTFVASDNNLNGALPGEVGRWTGLEFLEIETCDIRGAIPTTLGTLTNVKEIRLSDNWFNSSVPWSSLEVLSALEVFHVGSNDISGSLSFRTDATQWPKLKSFSVFDSFLEGTLPASMAGWVDLEKFTAFDTNVGGGLPTEFGLWTRLEYFSIASSFASGTIPVEYTSWTNLKEAYFFDTDLSGAMPLCNLPDLNLLYVVANCEDINCGCCDVCCPNNPSIPC